MKKLGLLPKLIIGLIAGIIIGKIGFVPLLRIMLTFNGLFGNFLQFVIPLIILGFVAPGIGDLGKKAGKLLAVTTVLAYGSTIVSGSLAFFTNSILLKKILPAGAALAEGSHPEAGLLSGYLTVDMPPIMGVMTALLMAFIIGIGIAVVEGTTLKNFMNEIQTIVEKIITNIIIPFLPLYIAGIFANMTYAGEIIKIMSVFAKVFGIIIILHFVILLVQYTIAGTLAGANPLLLIRKMLPAYFTAIGTQSSAATIPVTLNQTKENGVNEGIADFTIPLCATIHLSGSTITLVSCSMAVMMLHGMPITFSGMFGFILMLGVTMVAAPGVPGGAVMAALGLLESMLGFGPELTSLMIALYLTQDSFGTACNVTGDGAIAIMVNKIAGFNLVKRVKKKQ
ncbi:Na(+)/serine-threonine symporter [Fusobacterium varium]|nr:dicarboxylate/amino acid:cation symporter [Fusobacterium varium]VEH38949.1 Na(+)/serine-threonine symporter [Fusobacterium varium]